MDELIYYFVNDNELLELINSDASDTMKDESINKSKKDTQSITFWDTTKVTKMKDLFVYNYTFNELLLWNTENVTNMYGMFSGASSFNQPLEFNTENVLNMSFMFSEAKSFNQPLEFNTMNVSNMSYMFDGMSGMFNNSGMKNMPHWYNE